MQTPYLFQNPKYPHDYTRKMHIFTFSTQEKYKKFLKVFLQSNQAKRNEFLKTQIYFLTIFLIIIVRSSKIW